MRGKKEGTHATIISFHVSTCLYDFRCRVAAQEKLCEAELQSPNIVSQRHPRARGHLDKWRQAITNHSELEEKWRKEQNSPEDKGNSGNTFRFWHVLLVSCLIGRLHPEPVSSRSFSTVKHWSKTSFDMFRLQVALINLPQDTNTHTRQTILTVSHDDLLSSCYRGLKALWRAQSWNFSPFGGFSRRPGPKTAA